MKYSYITLLNTESYLDGVLVLNESLKNVNAKYPLVVAITDEISENTKNILNHKKIDTIKIKKMEVPEDIKKKNSKGMFAHWSNTFDKLKIFELTDFNKLVFLDSDMYVMKNIDELFERPNLSAVIDRREPNTIKEWVKLTSGTLVIEPKEDIVNEFLEVMKDIQDKRESIGDQDVLQEYDKNWENKPNLHLDVKYNTFFIYLDYYIKSNQYKLEDIAVVHFILKTKPWTLTKEKIDTYLDFLNSRLNFNFEYTKKQVFKDCIEMGSENRKKVLEKYLDVLYKVKNN